MRLWGGEGGVSGRASGVWMRCGWGRVEGVSGRASGVCLGERRGVVGERLGASGAQMGLKSHVFAGGKKFERKRMTGQRFFVAMLDGFGMTPV